LSYAGLLSCAGNRATLSACAALDVSAMQGSVISTSRLPPCARPRIQYAGGYVV